MADFIKQVVIHPRDRLRRKVKQVSVHPSKSLIRKNENVNKDLEFIKKDTLASKRKIETKKKNSKKILKLNT